MAAAAIPDDVESCSAVKKTFSRNDGIIYLSNSIDLSTFGTCGKFD